MAANPGKCFSVALIHLQRNFPKIDPRCAQLIIADYLEYAYALQELVVFEVKKEVDINQSSFCSFDL